MNEGLRGRRVGQEQGRNRITSQTEARFGRSQDDEERGRQNQTICDRAKLYTFGGNFLTLAPGTYRQRLRVSYTH